MVFKIQKDFMYNMESFIKFIEQQFLYTFRAGIKYQLALSDFCQECIFLTTVMKPK